MEETRRLVTSQPLVTLLGAGGTGKTRLSLQIGADLLEQFPDGVWFVELAPLTDTALIGQTMWRAFPTGIEGRRGRARGDAAGSIRSASDTARGAIATDLAPEPGCTGGSDSVAG